MSVIFRRLKIERKKIEKFMELLVYFVHHPEWNIVPKLLNDKKSNEQECF